MFVNSNATSNTFLLLFLNRFPTGLNFFFNHIYLLLLVVVGCLGNALVIIIFGQKAFRTTIRGVGASVSVYPFLFYMAISDTMYLLVLFCLWLSNYINVLHRPVICQVTLYLTYVCNFINAYYTIAFTAQRLFAVVKPFRVSHVLSWYRSRCLALSLILFAFLLYSYIPVLVDTEKGICYSRDKYRWINEYMDVIDCIVVFLIPYIVIIAMNTAILISLRRMKQTRQVFLFQSNSKFNRIRELTRRNASRRMTKLILTISTSYLIIGAPYACIHTWRLLAIGHKELVGSPVINRLEYYAHCIYHMSFAMNFYIYIVFGSKFRRELRRLFIKSRQNLSPCCRKQRRFDETDNQLELDDKHSSNTTADESYNLNLDEIHTDQYLLIRNCCCRCHFEIVNR